jgi:hypothetical protein
MLSDLWRFVRNGKNRTILSWIGGGAVVVIAAAWAVFVYIFPSHRPAHAQANCGSIAIGGNVAGTNIAVGTTMRDSDCSTPKP